MYFCRVQKRTHNSRGKMPPAIGGEEGGGGKCVFMFDEVVAQRRPTSRVVVCMFVLSCLCFVFVWATRFNQMYAPPTNKNNARTPAREMEEQSEKITVIIIIIIITQVSPNRHGYMLHYRDCMLFASVVMMPLAKAVRLVAAITSRSASDTCRFCVTCCIARTVFRVQ